MARGYGYGYGYTKGNLIGVPSIGIAIAGLIAIPENASNGTVVATVTGVNLEDGVSYEIVAAPGQDGAFALFDQGGGVYEMRVADSDLIVCPQDETIGGFSSGFSSGFSRVTA